MVTSIPVKYYDNGVKKKEIRFKGNFGFDINGKKYYTNNGKVYDSNNKEVKVLELSKSVAYQFIGMSCTAENARDYTYSEKDLNEAKNDYQRSYSHSQERVNGILLSDYRSMTVIGNGAGRVLEGSTKYQKDVYSTQYESNENGQVSTVSIWLRDI